MEKDWSYEDEWFEEGNIAMKIKDWLESEGYQIIKFNADKKKKGDDIRVKNKEEEIIIEICEGGAR